MRRRLTYCLATLLLIAASAAAQYRGGYQSYNYPSYSYPVYVEKPVYYKEIEYRDNYIPVATPVPFTVAVPVVSYLYNGATYGPALGAQAAYPAQGVQALQALQQQRLTAQQSYAGGTASAAGGAVPPA